MFALDRRPHKGEVKPDGSLELTYYCCRGPNASKTFIKQYVPLGESMQRQNAPTLKRVGCSCHVKLQYPNGSFPSVCPISKEPFPKETAVGKAIQQQMLSQAGVPDVMNTLQQDNNDLHSPASEAAADSSSGADSAVATVQIRMQLHHSSHEPGSTESWKHLPADEVYLL